MALLGSAPAHAAAAATIEVTPQVGQQVALDPNAVTVQVRWKGNDCRSGCELWRVGRIGRESEYFLVDSATFAPGSAPKTVSDKLEYPPLVSSWDYQVRKKASGATLVNHYVDTTFDTEGSLRYVGSWRARGVVTSTCSPPRP